jgi:hypothetical protein
MSRWVSGSSLVDLTRAGYERIRAAHLNAVQAAVEDRIARLDWSRKQIDAIGPSGCGASLQTHANGHYFTPAAIGLDPSRRRAIALQLTWWRCICLAGLRFLV